MRIAALVQQVPAHDGAESEMEATSRRVAAQAVELAAAVGDGECTAITVGTERAEDVLRETIAWASSCSVMADGILVSDPAFEELDTLGIARVLAATIEREGPYDLILVGDHSSDHDDGAIGPHLAELLDLPFLGPARFLSMQGHVLHVRCERDEGFMQATVSLPAIVSCGMDLIPPCEIPASVRTTVVAERMRTVAAADLGWKAERDALAALAIPAPTTSVPASRGVVGPAVVVVAELGHENRTRALIGLSAALAAQMDGHVVALTTDTPDASVLGSWGADEIVAITGAIIEEDVARALADWGQDTGVAAVMASTSPWGREISGRSAVRLSGEIPHLTIRPGPDVPEPRAPAEVAVRTINVRPRRRVRVASRTHRELAR